MRYFSLGEIPAKRHQQFRQNGTLLDEEVLGYEGFSGNESILYHLWSPCRVKEVGEFEPIEREEWVPDTHVHRLTNTLDLERPREPVRRQDDVARQPLQECEIKGCRGGPAHARSPRTAP